MNIEHIIFTKRMFFGFGIATFWRENDVTNLAPKINSYLLVILCTYSIDDIERVLKLKFVSK